MTSVDTNVVVRLLTQDHPQQAAAANALFAEENIWIADTVLLETSWVLNKVYKFEESAVRDALTKLLGLENVYTDDKRALAEALALTDHGVELADAIHLSGRPKGSSFATFDQGFVRCAKRAGAKDIFELATKEKPFR